MAIQYLVTAYIDSWGKYSKTATKYAIHDVVRIIDGNIEDNLSLLIYPVNVIQSLLAPGCILHHTDRLTEFKSIDIGSLIVIYQDELYGVVIENKQARIVGKVKQMYSNKIDDNKNCFILKMPGNLQQFPIDSFEPKKHILLAVPLGGHCFLSSSLISDAFPDRNQSINNSLTLFVGLTLLALENILLDWRRPKQLWPESNLSKYFFVYNGGLLMENESNAVFFGLGPRSACRNEIYYYFLMHYGCSFHYKCIDKNPIKSDNDSGDEEL